MADRLSIRSLTTRDEFRKTQVLLPSLQVNLDWIRDALRGNVKTYISPYFSACSFAHLPCWKGGNWKVLPKMGIPGIAGGNLYFRLLIKDKV